jgi:hypothetical protein
MRRIRHLITAVAATGLAAAVPIATASAAAPGDPALAPASTSSSSPAPGSAVLTLGGPTGPPAAVGSLVSASLFPDASLRLLESTTELGLYCDASTWVGQVVSNPAVPGTAVLTLLPSGFTASMCTDNNPKVISVTNVVITGLPDTLMITGAGSFPIQILPPGGPLTITENLTVSGIGASSCVFQAIAPTAGTALGGGFNPWNFVNQPFKLVSGIIGPCGMTTSDLFSAEYSPIVDSGAHVYVN